MEVTLYTIGCPKCTVLATKLNQADIVFDVCDDTDKMLELGIETLPVLSIDGKLLNFIEAVNWINERK